MRYRITVKRTEINDYYIEAASSDEARELLTEGIEAAVIGGEARHVPEWNKCEHRDPTHGIFDEVLDDDFDDEIVSVEEMQEEHG